MKKSKKKNNIIKDALKQARKESREAEIKAHGKPINRTKIQASPKVYKRVKKVDLGDLDNFD